MGIGIVLLLWAVVGSVLACVGALIMGATATFLTRHSTRDRTLTLLAAIAFPFVCVAWAAALFVFQALVNGTMHRDPGLGDSWNCPLPNGYAITMIDTTDYGWVYNPKTQSGGGLSDQEDAVSGVRLVQVSGRYILGGADSHSFASSVSDHGHVDSYFLLDTQAGKRENFSNVEALGAAALQRGVHLNLEPLDAVYSRYRYTWFDIFVGALLCVPLLVYLVLLGAGIVRLRRSAQMPAAASA
jgi:hypothetical protein